MNGTRGVSLAELLVALTLLAVGGGMSARLLIQATRETEAAELGLRAALFLSELWEANSVEGGGERSAGPGVLIGEGGGIEARVRFVPPIDGTGLAEGSGGSGGFQRARRWELVGEGEL
jgi:prepilin-type N-terminal cleavage/methylation domain-containing protein